MSNNKELIADYVLLARCQNHQLLVFKALGWPGPAQKAILKRDNYMVIARMLKSGEPE